MSAHVLLNLWNELGKRDKMRGLWSILSLSRNEFNKFNNTKARMLDTIYHMKKSGLENSTRPLVFTSASGCRASENFDISSENKKNSHICQSFLWCMASAYF